MKDISKYLLFCAFLLGSVFAAGSLDAGSLPLHKIVVEPLGNRAVVTVLEKRGVDYVEIMRTDEGFVGRSGVSEKKKEGDGATPVGEFDVRRAFGIAIAPKTALPYRQVREGDLWIDDPWSVLYNEYLPVEEDVRVDWKSSEDLFSFAVYKYVIVIEYNTSFPMPGMGSAIFLHCSGNKPTAGCVSVPEDFMLKLLEIIVPGDKIIILPES